MKNDKQYLTRYLVYLKAYKGLLAGGFLLIPLISACTILQPLLIKKALDDAILANNIPALKLYTTLFGLCIFCEFIGRSAQVFIFQIVGQKTVTRIRADLFSHVLLLSSSYYDKTPVGTIISRLTSDIESLNESIASGLVTLLADLLTLIGILVMMVYLSPSLTLTTLLVLPPMMLLVNFFRNRLRVTFGTIRSGIGKLNAFIQEQLQGISVIQIYTREAHTLRRFKRLNQGYKKATLHSVTYDASLYSLIESINAMMIAAMIWYGFNLYGNNIITIGLLVAFIDYIHKFFTPLKEISSKFATLQHALAALDKIFSTFEIRDHIPFGNTSLQTQVPCIGYQDVSFHYPGHRKKILASISFTVQPGEVVALVGPTGSGKTSVLRLLSRLYQDYSGNITINNTCIKTLDEASISQLISVVNQESTLFSESYAFNISLGHAHITQERIEWAAKLVGIHAFITTQPNGYHTILDNGNNSISAGQAQRIAFARALANPAPILLLDEATSAVDSFTEQHIQAGLKPLLREKTALVIAHRLSTIKHASLILALNQGRIVEQGTHNELMKTNGFYANLYSIQYQHM